MLNLFSIGIFKHKNICNICVDILFFLTETVHGSEKFL